jgi:hypothetical protein
VRETFPMSSKHIIELFPDLPGRGVQERGRPTTAVLDEMKNAAETARQYSRTLLRQTSTQEP